MSTSFWGESGGFLDDLDVDEGGGSDVQQQDKWVAGRDGLIMLIDATRPMFEKKEDGEIAFHMCLKCARNTLMGKAISSDKDLVSIIFFGTQKTKNSNGFKNIFVYQDLDMPDAERIKDIEQLMTDVNQDKFANSFGHSQDFSMSDAFWACSNVFANCSFKIGSRRILLFTNNDDPHELNYDLKRRALRKAEDLSDLGILIDLMHIQRPGMQFDGTKFYKDVVVCDDDEDNEIFADPSEKFEELLARVQGKDYKKRAVARLPLKISSDLEFGVAVYVLNRSASNASSYVKIDSRTNEEVKTVTKMICEDTGQELMPTDIKYSQEFGGEKVIFEKNEIQNMKSFGEPGLHLLGFKSIDLMKPYYYVKPGQFIYPDDTIISGSKTIFAALLNRCISRKVVPICCYIPRSSSSPRLVALVPQKEEYDEHNYQLKPPGFHLRFLPFSDDLRKLSVEEAPKATIEQIDKAKEIISNLTFKFSSENFENPTLQKFFRTLEALALDRNDVEPVSDMTLPNTSVIEEKAGQRIEDFKSLVFPDGYDAAAGKRKATAGQGGAEKKVKVSASDIDMENEAKNGKLSKLTVPVLKDFCQSNKIKPASSKKADLIDAIMNHLNLT